MRVLRGPNIWAKVPVLVADVPTGAGGRLARLARQFQNDAGSPVSFAQVSGGTAAVEFEDEELGRRCFEAALRGEETLPSTIKEFADDILLGANTRALYDAARRRGIPVRRLDPGSLLQLGHGFRQRRLCGAFTDRTASIGEDIGWTKPLAKEILRAVGVPVPEGRLVTDAEDAWRATGEFGGFVVVKPESANHGRSVFIGLRTREEIAAAFESASTAAENPNVLVERCITGSEHRVLVVDGSIAAATRGDPLYVTGDGVRTIQEFMDEINCDPRRGSQAWCPLSPVGPDEETNATLARQGFTVDAVPDEGVQVLIQRNGNSSIDVTDEIHPENHEIFAVAARAIGLDVAGIDCVAEDLSRPLREQGGAILEVNAMPGLMMHLHPAVGKPRAVDEIIVASIFPEGNDGRIPIIAVCSGSEDAAEEIAGLLQARGIYVGLTSESGMFAGGVQIRRGNCATSACAADLLMHPLVQVAVCETPDSAIVEEGLAFDRCNVIVGEPPLVLRESLVDGGLLTASVAEAVAFL